jgi:hypothetical protein
LEFAERVDLLRMNRFHFLPTRRNPLDVGRPNRRNMLSLSNLYSMHEPEFLVGVTKVRLLGMAPRCASCRESMLHASLRAAASQHPIAAVAANGL